MQNHVNFYTYFRPNDSLSSFIDCFYQIKDKDSSDFPKVHFTYPDGYPEIIINLGGAYHREDLITGKTETVPHRSCIIIGQKLRSFRILQEDNCDIISLKLKPYGLQVLQMEAQRISANKVSFANNLLGVDLLDLINALTKIEDGWTRLFLVQQFLKAKRFTETIDQDNARIIDYIQEKKGLVRIDSICDQFGVTSRTLENRFQNQIGLGPKEFCAIVQFNNFIIKSNGGIKTITELALDCGYYDQAHLNRKFKLFTNSTPKDHLSKRNLLTTINTDILQKQLSFRI